MSGNEPPITTEENPFYRETYDRQSDLFSKTDDHESRISHIESDLENITGFVKSNSRDIKNLTSMVQEVLGKIGSSGKIRPDIVFKVIALLGTWSVIIGAIVVMHVAGKTEPLKIKQDLMWELVKEQRAEFHKHEMLPGHQGTVVMYERSEESVSSQFNFIKERMLQMEMDYQRRSADRWSGEDMRMWDKMHQRIHDLEKSSGQIKNKGE